jgi:hypothetical protein
VEFWLSANSVHLGIHSDSADLGREWPSTAEALQTQTNGVPRSNGRCEGSESNQKKHAQCCVR